MKRFLWTVLLFTCGFASASAHDIITTNLTYTRDISRIFARRCISCHAEGSSVPLASYEEVRPWAVDIKEQVLSRAMPPWGAVKGFGNLAPDLGLSQEELLIIAAWVVGGAPQGDNSYLAKQTQALSSGRAKLLSDALIVSTKINLKQPVSVAGIKPLAAEVITSSRVTAHLPDGRIQPLIWLYQYDPKWERTFSFREPVLLPAGTVIESSSPLQFVLESEFKAISQAP